jgi:predicted house-cleaning noncanonical NTP pyrophosphatase (MazG superfamily)
MKPKKLIRKNITEKLKEGEWETITDQAELNKLYAIKVREELREIQLSGHSDIMEFVDLIQVAFSFAKQNGFTHEQLSLALIEKTIDKGNFGRLALNNLNPSNPSNALYFETDNKQLLDFIKWIDEEEIGYDDGRFVRYFNGKDNYITLEELYNVFLTHTGALAGN